MIAEEAFHIIRHCIAVAEELCLEVKFIADGPYWALFIAEVLFLDLDLELLKLHQKILVDQSAFLQEL